MPRMTKRQRKEDNHNRPRNPYAVEARHRQKTGGGFHGKGHPAKEESRTACRSNVNPNDFEDWREELELEDDDELE